MRLIRFSSAAFVAIALLAGCGGPTFETLLDSGRASVARKDYKTSIIELKSALQKRPDSAEARYLLGRALFESGDAGSAVVELDKSGQLGYSQALVAPPLARAMLALGRNKAITDRFTSVELADPRAAADLKTTIAQAFQRQNLSEQAETLIEEALTADPTYGPARLLRAVGLGLKGDLQGALGSVEEILKADASFVDAWVAKGRLMIALRKPLAEVRAAFQQVVTLDPASVLGHAALFDVALLSRDPVAMEEVVAAMRKALPKHPELSFYETQIAIAHGDFKVARERNQQLLKVSPNSLRVLYLAGVIAQATGSYIEAEGHLGKAVALAPDKVPSRRLLARVYLQMGQPEKAVQNLRPLVTGAMVDVESLALAAEAHLMLGDGATAYRLFRQASQADPTNPRLQTALAVARFKRGEHEAAFADLQAVAATDPSTLADMALISLRVSRKEFDGALKAIEGLRRKQPGKPFPLVVQGRVHLARKDQTASRASFEQAMQADGAYFPAVMGLVSLDLQEDKPLAARQRLEAFLKAQGTHPKALMMLADVIARAGGQPEESRTLLERAAAASPGDPAPRLALVGLLIRTGDLQRALTEAHAALAIAPTSVDVLDTLAGVQVRAGDFQQAAANYRKVADALQGGAAAQMRLAELLLALDDHTGAEQSFRRVVTLKPDHVAAQRRLVELMLRGGRYDEAMRVAKRVQEQRPRETVGWLLEADVEARRTRWDAALAALTAAAKRDDSTVVATRTHATLVAADRREQAEEFASSWIRRNPKTAPFVVYLGVYRLGQRDYAKAEAEFVRADAIRPNDPVTLNNIAYSLLMQGKKGAVEAATKADQLQPNTPTFLDTLALALVAEGRLDEALRTQERVVKLQPSDLNFRLTLAKVHIARGDKANARKELERLVASGRSFSGEIEAKGLLAKL